MSELVEGKPAKVITAMVTPFKAGRKIDFGGAQEVANYLVGHGSDGLVLAGTTGESPAMTVEDQVELFTRVREAVGKDVLLIGGTGSNITDEAEELSRLACEAGAVDALLVVVPYYNRPSQYGLRRHFEVIAEITDRPIVAYDIPVRTGRALGAETMRQLIDGGHVQGLKDATGSVDAAARLHQEYGDDFVIYSGDDGLNLRFYEVGASGAISVSSHWAGEAIQQMFKAHDDGDFERARAISEILRPSAEFESVHTDALGVKHDTPNPGPAKVVMAHLLGKSVIGQFLSVSPMLVESEEVDYLRRTAPTIINDIGEAMAELDTEPVGLRQ